MLRLFGSWPALVFYIYAGVGIVEVLDSTLSRMHLPGGASAGASTIASPSSLTSPDVAGEAISQWTQWSDRYTTHVIGQNPGDGLPLSFVLLIYAVTDILFIALPMFFLVRRMIVRATKRIEFFETRKKVQHDEDAVNRVSGLVGLLKMAGISVLLFVIADVLEGALLISAGLSQNWFVIALTGGASLLKWIFLGSALIGLVVGLIGSREMRRDPMVGLDSGFTRRDSGWAYMLALRIQIAIGLLLLSLGAMRGDLGHQLDDAFLFPFSRGGQIACWTAAVASILTLVILVTANLCMRAYLPKSASMARASTREALYAPVEPKRLARTKFYGYSLTGAVLTVVAVTALRFEWPFGVALIAPGVLLVLIAIYSRYADSDTKPDIVNTDQRTIRSVGWRYSIALAAIPFVVLGALAMRNGVRLLTIHQYRHGWSLIVIFPVCAIALGAVLMWLTFRVLRGLGRFDNLDRPEGERRKLNPSLWSATVAAALSLALFITVGLDPEGAGDRLGPWGSVFAFCVGLLLAGTALVLLSDHVRAWGVLAAVGFRRMPFIAAIVLCFVANAAIADRFAYHDVRLGAELSDTQYQPLFGAAPKPAFQIGLTQALDQWASEQRKNANGRREIPLVFIASAGGGIRAAYWTALTMRCLVAGGGETSGACQRPVLPKDSIFMASGISGGSLGLAGIHAMADDNDWLSTLQQDFLGPTVAAMAFRDIPNSLLRINIRDSDRATILERAWEAQAAERGGHLDRGLVETAYSEGGKIAFPLLVLTGTSVTDGCRVVASALDLSTIAPSGSGQTSATDCLALDQRRFSEGTPLPALPATKDAFDNTCAGDGATVPHDLRLSTAALLSARFPYVSPTGTLHSCSGSDRTFDLDGGLIDSSAASPIAMLWPEVVNWLNKQDASVCFAPKLIIMENGYLEQTKSNPAARPAELSAPLTGALAAQSAAAPTARQAAAYAFQKSFAGHGCNSADAPAGWQVPDVVDFYPVSQPGIEAPLGWTLSFYSQRSLEEQIVSAVNQCNTEIVAAWFSGSTSKPDTCNQRPSE
ncbi:hypothetical protein [Arthrobacter sp. SLBN-53]|uniref:hypothetical protein n=1 Tax=Arthrobacter sp. SLBN-53 TaxID=2768412 RepID=UPI001151C9A3|nr:hypothetical protein [Arthrobacter sp. SLBN-53]